MEELLYEEAEDLINEVEFILNLAKDDESDLDYGEF